MIFGSSVEKSVGAVSCLGNENSLDKCPTLSCSGLQDDAGVVCQGL